MVILLSITCSIVVFVTIGGLMHDLKKEREFEKKLDERTMLTKALEEKTQTEFTALCTTFGRERAIELILTDYKINHGYKFKD